MIVRTKVSDQTEQFAIDGKSHVGRRVRYLECESWHDVTIEVWEFPDDEDDLDLVELCQFRLDYDGGLVFVDPSMLRPYPSEKIEEPTK